MLRRDPLTASFDVVWRGYSRRQVKEFIDRELRWLTADRDAAITMVCKLTSLLGESRAEVRRLRERFDEQCREPLPAGAVSERMRRLVEMAHAEAAQIVARARARMTHAVFQWRDRSIGCLEEARLFQALRETLP